MISESGRLVTSTTALVSPAAIRAATSLRLRPVTESGTGTRTVVEVVSVTRERLSLAGRRSPGIGEGSGHAGGPLGVGELGAYELLGLCDLGVGEPAVDDRVPPAVRRQERRHHLGPRQMGLGTYRVDPLVRALRALVAELLPADPQHLEHLVSVDVVGHRHVVQDGSADEPLLRGPGDLARRRGDVVEARVGRLHAHGGERAQHPLVEEGVRLLVAHAVDERLRHDEGERDAVAGLHEHCTAARDPVSYTHLTLPTIYS